MSKILDLISGLIPGKKGDGNFFLELKEDVEETAIEVKKDVQSKVSEIKDDVSSKVNDALPTGASNGSTAPQQPSNGTSSATTEVKSENGKTAPTSGTDTKSKKVSIKERRKKEKEAAITAPTLPASETNKAKAVKPSEPQEKEFASKYLLSNGKTPRRRPGANMDGFLEMARGVKVPVKK